MKIKITPEKLLDFNHANDPALISIGRNRISFNKAAERLLSLKAGDCFSFDFEDGLLFLEHSSTGFRLTSSGKMKNLSASSHNMSKYLDTLYKKGNKIYRFRIAELKLGRRLLEPVA